MSRLALLAAVMILAGCGTTESVDIGEGVHTVSHTNGLLDLQSREDVLTAEADAACPEGWSKTAEHSSVGAAGTRLDWYIACN